MSNLNLRILDIFYGDTEVLKVMQGDTLKWIKQYKVETSFSNVEAEVSDYVTLGESLSISLTAADNYALIPASVKVTMGGIDITNTAFNPETNAIEIQEVTGNIVISARGASIPDTYTPLQYIFARSRQNRNAFQIPYHPNSNTKLEMDVSLYGDTYSVLYSKGSGINTAVSSSNPGWDVWVRYTSSTISGARCGLAGTNPSGNYAIAIGKRILFTMDKGKMTCLRQVGSIYSTTISQGTWSWGSDFFFFNTSLTGTSYPSRAILYGAKISEYNSETEEYTTLLDYVPVKRNSDGVLGIYDVVNGVFNANNYVAYIKPNVAITRTLTGCTQSLLSAANTGTGGNAVFGETWSSSFTPSSGYTFTHSSAIFQVLVNDVDKTNDYATYDSTTDVWTVTLVAHCGDSIAITARPIPYDAEVEYLQSDGTAYIELPMTIKSGDYLCVTLDMETLTTSTNKVLLDANSTNQFKAYLYAYNSNTNTITFATTVGANTSNGGITIPNGTRTTFLLSTTNAGTKTLARPIKSNFSKMTVLGSGMLVKLYGGLINHKISRIYELIPVRKDGVGYLYDKVSGQLFGNANSSGSFTYGNDV